MGNSIKNKFFRNKPKTMNIGLDINILIVTSFAQKNLAQAFKYSLDDKYPIKSLNEDDVYLPVRAYKNIRTDEKQNLDLSISLSRRVSVYNTEPYYDYFLDNRVYGFNMILLLYDSSTISQEDFQMTIAHVKKHVDAYNPEKTIGLDFDRLGLVPQISLPKWFGVILTKIPHDTVNFADKLLDRVFNADVILSDMSVTTDMPSVMSESTVRHIMQM